MIVKRWARALMAGAMVLILAAGPAAAEGAFEKELGSDVNAVVSKVNLSMMNGDGDGAESGRGPKPYLKKLGSPPKRVALASFYVWDCGNKKENFYNPVYKYKRTNNVTSEGVEVFANEFYDASIAGFKEAFASYGTTILTPDEFLNTDEKKAAYESFKLDMGAQQKFFKFMRKVDSDSSKFAGAAEGFKVLQLETIQDVKGHHFTLGATGIGVEKVAHSVGFELARKLEVDAVVIIYNVVQAEKKKISLVGSYMYMFGPNPVPSTGQSLYWDGHQYSGVYLRFDVPFVTTDKDGKLETSDYPGYSIVARALATRMGQHLKKKTTGEE